MESPASRSALTLLSIGASLGLAIACWSLLSAPERLREELPTGVVVRVNETMISSRDFEAFFQAAASEARQGASDSLRDRVLERLVEEELLVQRSLALGMARHDRRSRSTLVQALITTVTESAADVAPSDSDLEAFYERERDRFARTGRLQVEQFHFSTENGVDSAKKRAQVALNRLQAGDTDAAVRKELADEQVFEVPATLLPPAKLRDYIGSSPLSAVEALEVGGLTPALETASGIEIFRLVAREPRSHPALSEVRALVRSEWVRQRGERALLDYLDGLKSEAEIVYAP